MFGSQNEIDELKTTYRKREEAWKHEKGILEQKIQFLELQLSESKSREESLKQMSESIMGAMSDFSAEKEKAKVYTRVIKR